MSFVEISPGLFMIDAHMFGAPENLSTYVIPEPVPTLIEPGPTTCHAAVRRGLDAMGIDDIAQIAVTHIHLDHAGGTGHLLQVFPKAKVYVHSVGAPHLHNPEKLLRSANRIYGEEGMQSLWGSMLPIATTALIPVEEGDRIPIGSHRWLEVMYTPGHAKHHISLVDSESNIVMIGDSAGITFPEMDIVHPILPPPDINVESLIANFERYRQQKPFALAFSHFGLKTNVDHILEESEHRLRLWAGIAQTNKEKTPEQVGRLISHANLADLKAHGHSHKHIQRIHDRTDYSSGAQGLLRYVHTHAV